MIVGFSLLAKAMIVGFSLLAQGMIPVCDVCGDGCAN
jgi:hypothetical protein